MRVKPLVSVAAIAIVTGLLASVASAITIPTVPVGNPGNAPDPATGNIYGSVAYRFNIGTTEVTNTQYAAFLNAVAQTDTNGLYNANMAGAFGGIQRLGSAGSYIYAVLSGRENNPVNYVSFWDACRFANWLHNGQPTGAQSNSTTEDGAYTLTATGIANNTVTRNAAARWAVTSENEWYKAAYHQPAAQGGDSDNYWLYPTSSSSAPTTAQANYDFLIGNTTPVGSYTANFYGTFDMGGNVWEWNEAFMPDSRVNRGGSFILPASYMQAVYRNFSLPTLDDISTGFRVSQVFPTTTTITTVPIGNPRNAPDTMVMIDGTTGYGSVAYSFNIGTTEVTNAQYAAFLNAVAQTDSNNLYNPAMAGSLSGITRSGSPGTYTYATVSGRANNPVNWVSFWDACRFANWLHNGQPSGPQSAGTTEDGAYTLTPGGISANTTTRKMGARWAVASENEWYKAAYHQPAGQGGDSDGYWAYPTSSNGVPTTAQANFGAPAGNTFSVGSYAANFYGLFDMGGNVNEWNESVILGTERGIRGGNYVGAGAYLLSDDRYHNIATSETPGLGFRVVQLLEPSPCNRADADGDGTVTPDDLFTFLDRWFAQNGQTGGGLSADVDGSGAVSADDLFTFLDLWFEFSGTTC